MSIPSPDEGNESSPSDDQREIGSEHDHNGGRDAGIPPRGVRGHDPGHIETQGIDRGGRDVEQRIDGLAERGQLPPVRGPHGEYQPPVAPEWTAMAVAEFAEGPIPPPSMLRAFGDVDRSFPERLFRMAEKEQDAQIEAARRASRVEAAATVSGAITVPLLVIGLTVVACVLFWGGQNGAAATALISAIAVWLIPTLTQQFIKPKPAAPKPAAKKPSVKPDTTAEKPADSEKPT